MGHCSITKSKTYQSPTALFEPTKSSQLKERRYHENSGDEANEFFFFSNGGAPEFAQENVVHSSFQFESAQRNNRVKPETTEILPILKDTRKSHEILSGRIPLFCGILYGLNPVETGQHLKIL